MSDGPDKATPPEGVLRQPKNSQMRTQLDTADRQEPSESIELKKTYLKEKLEKLKSEMQKLEVWPPSSVVNRYETAEPLVAFSTSSNT